MSKDNIVPFKAPKRTSLILQCPECDSMEWSVVFSEYRSAENLASSEAHCIKCAFIFPFVMLLPDADDED